MSNAAQMTQWRSATEINRLVIAGCLRSTAAAIRLVDQEHSAASAAELEAALHVLDSAVDLFSEAPTAPDHIVATLLGGALKHLRGVVASLTTEEPNDAASANAMLEKCADEMTKAEQVWSRAMDEIRAACGD